MPRHVWRLCVGCSWWVDVWQPQIRAGPGFPTRRSWRGERVMDCINGAVLKSIEDVGGRDWCLCGTAVTGNPPGYGL